ncbi:MAG: thioredoxin fold domain-containing protein [Elusimicrobia bacterium]|nr:thioredoxin fold domain-containing protein [Elusimicrobiota bacterium]
MDTHLSKTIKLIIFLIFATLCGLSHSQVFAKSAPSLTEEFVIEHESSIETLDEEASRLEDRFNENFVFALIIIFLIGLALNLTPCIYPMLAVTVSIFGQAETKGRSSSIIRAGIYVLGIASMYSVLGVVASFTGGLFGGLLQSKIVLIFIAFLFSLLALSMFGLFELRIPTFLTSKLAHSGLISNFGIYLSGLFVGIFAAPCIGPPIIGLMTLVAYRGDPVFGFLVFFILSMGLGFPYLILGSFSGLLNKMPRSGDWMVWVRKLMGLILISFTFFYLSLAFGDKLLFILIPLTLLIGGLYLGFIDSAGNKSKVFKFIKRISGVLFILAGVFVYSLGRSPRVEWLAWSPAIEEAAYNNGKMTIIYFSADWCIPCQEMQLKTFSNPDLIKELSSFNLLKADLTSFDSPASVDLRERYNISGVPTLIFIDSKGSEIRDARGVGYLGAENFISTLQNLTDSIAGDSSDYKDFKSTNYSEVILVNKSEWISPGEVFEIGLLFLMEDGWHTYWQNPGDSGMAPIIEWSLPEGFTIGQVSWPYPKKYDEGSYEVFGHDNFLLLKAQVNPPDKMTSVQRITFGAKANWLICKDICLSEQAEFSLTLPVKEEPAPILKIWEHYFEKTESMLPIEDPSWSFRALRENGDIKLLASPPKNFPQKRLENAEFFPINQGEVESIAKAWEIVDQEYCLTMKLTGELNQNKILEGVLVFSDEDTPKALSIKAIVE